MTDDLLRRTVEARRAGLVMELEQLDEVLGDIAQATAESDADFLREAKRELDQLIARAWGPPIRKREDP